MLRVSELLATVKFEEAIEQERECEREQKAKACHPDIVCPVCNVKLVPEHAHMRCPKCHYRDSCCF